MTDLSLPIFKWAGRKIGMAGSVAISCLHLDKRKSLMSSLESRNDMVRCNRQWRYKFIVNVTLSLFHGVINVDAIIVPCHFPSKPGESPEGSQQLTCPPVTSSVTPHRSST
jgi:hypothetical protein